jgi:hypothetical protein
LPKPVKLDRQSVPARPGQLSSDPARVRVAVGSTFVNIMCGTSSRVKTGAAVARPDPQGEGDFSLELDVFVRQRHGAPPGRTQRLIRSFVMSSSQSLTTTEMLRFRFLIAVFARIIALLRWFQFEVRNVRRGDQCQPCVLIGPGCWALTPLGGQACAPIVTVLGHDAGGGREGPSTCGRLSLVLFPDRLSPSRPIFGPAADPGGWVRRVDFS